MSAMPTFRAQTLLVGGDDRPPVILVHGAAKSGRVWTFLQDELAHHGWSSRAIDLRGHGASTAADLGITRMADYADDDRVRTPPDDSLLWSPVGARAD